MLPSAIASGSPTPPSEDPRAGPAPRARSLAAVAGLAVVTAGVATWAATSVAVAPEVTQAESEGRAAESPSDPDAWMARGAALEAEQAYGRSADAYRRAVELRPQDLRAQVRLGLVLLKAGDPAGAEAVARRILAGRPAHPEGVLVLGLAQRARGLPEARGRCSASSTPLPRTRPQPRCGA
jgi:cytochrome c-type biogenesis protein CcmH